MILEDREPTTDPAGTTESPETDPGHAGSEVDDHEETLAARLAASEAKAQENWERYVRTVAELDNLRKRAQREVENAHRFALEGFLSELLPVKDSLELGLSGTHASEPSAADILQGTQLTLKLMGQVLAKRGVEEINPEGELFNPERHEAIGTTPAAGVEPNRVVQVVQKGYLLNGRLLRPARVIVAGPGGS